MENLRFRSRQTFAHIRARRMGAGEWLAGVAAFAAVAFALGMGAPGARADHTRRWRQSTYEDFLKGTAHGISLRSDGKLELSPKFKLLADADTSYLWELKLDAKGVLYAAGGSPAKVWRFDANGKPALVFASSDLGAQAIAFDANGNLYVGTSPDGKVYKVTPAGEKSVFFDPKAKYIWDLASSPDGTIYVATGDKGQIFAVAPDGKSEVFYSSDEAHIRVLAFDAKHNLIAGTEPSGRVLRIARENGGTSRHEVAAETKGFVLYETAKREVTALAVGPDGTIYVSAVGDKQRAASTPAPTTVLVTPQSTATVTPNVTVAPQGGTPFQPFPPALSSSIYRIGADGAPEELWSSRDQVVYALGIAPDGRLLAGTGNNGELLAIGGHGVFAQLAKSGSSQITGIATDGNGKTFLCTANPGKVFAVGPEYEAEGTFESRSFDAQLFSQWGRLEWWSSPVMGDKNRRGNARKPRVEFYARSGNTEDPGKEWSKWYGPYTSSGAAIEAPPARFVQWKAVIHDGAPGDGVDWVSLAYLPHNVAPVIDGIAVQEPGVRVQAAAGVSGQPQTVTLRMPPGGNPSGLVISSSSTPKFEQPPQGLREKGWQSVVWTAHDENDDDLRFSVYFRGENETQWKLLKDKLEQHYYSIDTTTLPDGAYYLKIVVTDALSNAPGEALSAERESERFEVDNTPPVIEGLQARAGQNGETDVKFEARDAATSVERAQYSVDGGDWILLAPLNKISDAPEERYEFKVAGLSPGEHTISVRAYDLFENVGSAKATVAVAGSKP